MSIYEMLGALLFLTPLLLTLITFAATVIVEKSREISRTIKETERRSESPLPKGGSGLDADMEKYIRELTKKKNEITPEKG